MCIISMITHRRLIPLLPWLRRMNLRNCPSNLQILFPRSIYASETHTFVLEKDAQDQEKQIQGFQDLRSIFGECDCLFLTKSTHRQVGREISMLYRRTYHQPPLKSLRGTCLYGPGDRAFLENVPSGRALLEKVWECHRTKCW